MIDYFDADSHKWIIGQITLNTSINTILTVTMDVLKVELQKVRKRSTSGSIKRRTP